ncbi:MAG: hypothetical protein ACE3JP_02085 [Ectobacillus sp.]
MQARKNKGYKTRQLAGFLYEAGTINNNLQLIQRNLQLIRHNLQLIQRNLQLIQHNLQGIGPI